MFPTVNENSEDEQIRGLQQIVFLNELSERNLINVKELNMSILDEFCIRPLCTECPVETAYGGNCKHETEG